MQKFIGFAIKIAISLALLYFAVRRVDLGTLGARLQQIDPGLFLAAIACLGLQAFLSALRWRTVAQQCGASIPASDAFRIILIAGFFNQTLPSTVGGDAARIWILARRGAGWAKAAYSVLIDRVAGVLMLAVIVIACMPWSFDLIRNPIGRVALLAIGFCCIAGPAVFVALGMRHWGFLEHLSLTRHLAEAASAANRIFTTPPVAGRIAALSLAVHGLTIWVAWLAAKSVAAPFELVHSLLLLPPVLLIATIPVSIAGWGVRESAMVLAFSYAGLPESDGLLVSVLYGAALFMMGAIGGIVWLGSPGARQLGPKSGGADQRP